MGFLQKINDGFSEFLNQGDPRVKSWAMMQTPFPGFVLIAAYIYFVKVAGPKWMKRKKAFDLRNTMLLYNFTMVFANLYIFIEIGRYGWFNNYSLRCEPVDYSYKYEAVRMAEVGWLYYVIKFAEFADTIFFVLRKKDSHISPLHVIHHSIVPFSVWFGIKFAPGGYNSLFPFLNSFVHVLMYSYYGLAALGPQIQKYLIWKKCLTYIQMGQFLFVFLYTAFLVCFGTCEISKVFIVANAFHSGLFFMLFVDFFRKAYRTPRKDQRCIKMKAQEVCAENDEKVVPQRKQIADTDGNIDGRTEHPKQVEQHEFSMMKQITNQVPKLRPSRLKNGHVVEFKMKFSTDFSSLCNMNNSFVQNDAMSDSLISKCTVRNRSDCVSSETVDAR